MTLVAIDIILHRKPAYRHLLHNRQAFESSTVSYPVYLCLIRYHLSLWATNCVTYAWCFLLLQSIRWMMMGAISVNSILKLTVLHNSTYQNLFSFFPSLHLVASTGTEHAVFVSAVFFGKGMAKSRWSISWWWPLSISSPCNPTHLNDVEVSKCNLITFIILNYQAYGVCQIQEIWSLVGLNLSERFTLL